MEFFCQSFFLFLFLFFFCFSCFKEIWASGVVDSRIILESYGYVECSVSEKEEKVKSIVHFHNFSP